MGIVKKFLVDLPIQRKLHREADHNTNKHETLVAIEEKRHVCNLIILVAFGAKPAKGSFYKSEENPEGAAGYPRPEVERRPETGDRSIESIFAFDGATPETINGRLAMLGFVWALFAEKATGLTVAEQIFSPGATGQIFFIVVVQLFTYASVVPIMNGESTDARSWGPFNARAERWNGRLAMLGFAALLLDEFICQTPIFH